MAGTIASFVFAADCSPVSLFLNRSLILLPREASHSQWSRSGSAHPPPGRESQVGHGGKLRAHGKQKYVSNIFLKEEG